MKLNLHFTEHGKDQDEDQVISFTKRQNRTTSRNKSKTVIHDDEEGLDQKELKQQQQFLNDDPSLHGLLTQEEADISETALEEEDYKLYEMSLKNTLPPTFSHNSQSRNSNSTSSSTGGKGKGKDLFKLLKSRANHHNNSKSSSSSASSIRKVYFGTNVSITPWYSAPYPSEYHGSSGELWICEFCLKYMKRPEEARRHLLKCNCRLPPGDEIYRDAKAGISVFEINGRDSKLYCQNLCLLAKMFLDHKTLYYDVDPFLFYVLIEWKQLTTSPSQNNNNNRFTYSFVGYFSKEKVNPAGFNVSCILTMPHHQRKGYGSFLIDFSYLLSRREGKLGSPEKPLSDLGLFSYVSYWKNKLISYFATYLTSYRTTEKQPLTVETICTATGMTENDILSTLEYLKMLRFDVIKPPENNNNSSTNLQPVLKASIVLDLVIIENYQIKMRLRGGSGGQLEAKDEFLRWHPFKCTR